MSKEKTKLLVSFDTDRIKEYIFATNSLSEIRGASAILREQDNARKNWDGIFYTAGGSGALEVNSIKEANKQAAEAQEQFLRHTHSATITAVSVSYDELLEGDGFKDLMNIALCKQEIVKREKTKLIDIPVEPYFRLCESCGVRTAQERWQESGNDKILCLSCWEKNEIGKKVRNPNYRGGFVKEFRDYAKNGNEFWQTVPLAESLEELGKLDSSRYVGFINLDGNQMGMLLRQIYSKELLENYSKLLETKMRDLIFETLIEISEKIYSRIETLPFEIVLIGGDDMMLFTTADIAMTFCVEVMKKFETELSGELLEEAGLKQEQIEKALMNGEIKTSEYEQMRNMPFYRHGKLTLSASVVLCHPNFPITALVEIAENLLKDAKKFCTTKDYREGAIEFQVITGSAMNVKQTRELMVHNRPYTLSRMGELLNFARKFAQSGFPTSQLQMLYEACHESRASGTMMALRLLARLKNKQHQKLLRDFFVRFSESDSEKPTVWPWIQKGREEYALHSATPDLIELANFSKRAVLPE